MKSRGALPPTTTRRASAKRYVQYSHGISQPIASGWPRPRPTKPSPAAQQAMDQWSQIIGWMKYADPEDVAAAYEMSRGTLYMPRDILSAIMTGSIWQARLAAGKVIGSYRYMSGVSQSMLDTLSTTPGALAVRGTSAWQSIEPGSAGDVLTCGGQNVLPYWSPQASGGGGVMEWVSTQDVSGATDIEISTLDTATYTYLVIAQGLSIPPGYLRLTMATSGTTWLTSGYYGSTALWGSGGYETTYNSDDTSQTTIGYGNDSYPMAARLEIIGGHVLSTFSIFGTDGHYYLNLGTSCHPGTDALTAVRIKSDATGPIVSGLVYTYRVAKS